MCTLFFREIQLANLSFSPETKSVFIGISLRKHRSHGILTFSRSENNSKSRAVVKDIHLHWQDVWHLTDLLVQHVSTAIMPGEKRTPYRPANRTSQQV